MKLIKVVKEADGWSPGPKGAFGNGEVAVSIFSDPTKKVIRADVYFSLSSASNFTASLSLDKQIKRAESLLKGLKDAQEWISAIMKRPQYDGYRPL